MSNVGLYIESKFGFGFEFGLELLIQIEIHPPDSLIEEPAYKLDR